MMREFSSFEKQILHIMVDLQKSNRLSRQNIILTYYPKLYIDIEKDGNWDCLFIFYNDDVSISEKVFTHITIQIYFLYNYLSSEHFIEGLNFFHRIEPIRKNEHQKKLLIHDYAEFFINKDNLYNELILSETIVKLVENEFLTDEQLRFKQQMDDATTKHKEAMPKAKTQIRFSQGAFYVALLAFLVSLVSAIITQCSNDNKLIRDEIHSVKTETPKLMNQKIKNDTLKVNMIKK